MDYEKQKQWPLEFIEAPGLPLSYRVTDKMRLSKDKTRLTVNPSLTLAGIPPQTFDYRLGNRSALEWVIDQYQVSTDPRSGITSDPNREDGPQYITRLVGQVVRVSIDTMKIVNSLPAQFSIASGAATQWQHRATAPSSASSAVHPPFPRPPPRPFADRS